MINKLTVKQKQTLEAIAYFINTNGYPPTIQELCELVGNRSKATMFSKLMQLEQKGYIKTTNGKARSIVVMKGWE